MDNQEIARRQRQVLEEQRQLLAKENPEVANWIKTKKVIRNVLLLYLALHTVFTIIVMLQAETSGSIAMEIFKLLFQMMWLCVFVNPEGSWKLSLIVYFWALANLAILLQAAGDLIGSLPYIFVLPAYGIVVIMEILAPFLFLVVAIYLTAFPKHRNWSEQAKMFRDKMASLMKNISTGGSI